MPTSLGDLLDILLDTARRHPDAPHRAVVAADAATALGHLGRALAQLRTDGISPMVGDIRERQVLQLARVCHEVSLSAPPTNARLTELAAACADTVAVQRRHTTVRDRWALAAAFIDMVEPLCDLLEHAAAPGPLTNRLAALRRHSLHAEQTVSLNPPERADSTVLDGLIPAPFSTTHPDGGTVIHESIAVLSLETRSNATTLSLAEALAVTFAGEALSHAARAPATESAHPPAPYQRKQATAADAWQAVRTSLTPFTDGTRHMHTDPPPIARAALTLHRVARQIAQAPDGQAAAVRVAIANATQHLPGIAADLHRRAVSWADTGALLAFACDLPVREHNLVAHHCGYRSSGVIRADAVDLKAVTDALHNVRLLSTELACRAVPSDAAPFARRNWAAHQAVLIRERASGEISDAKHDTYRQLHAAARECAPRRGR